MAKIIVNSDPSFERGDVQDNPSHPGTNGDDIFIISPDSHGYPMANDDENRSGGKDTFRLSTDVDAKNKTPHPYQEGGGIVLIQNFGVEDKIVLPDDVPMEELLILRYGYHQNPNTKEYQSSFELVHDPHDLYWYLYGIAANISEECGRFQMNLEEGIAKITGATSRNTAWNTKLGPEPDPEYGDPRAITTKINQLRDPSGFRECQREASQNFRKSDLYSSGAYIYGADRLASFESTWSKEKPSLHKIMRTISTKDGTNFHQYANSKPKENQGSREKTVSIPNKFNAKAVDKITRFNPSSDTLKIDTDSFGIDTVATFAAGKNSRAIKKLAKKDFDFIYDQKKGGLYFNENGPAKGFGDGGIIAILKGAPDLSGSNLEFIGSTIYAPKKFNKKSADQITNFNPSTDTLDIDTDSFGIDSPATFAAGKNNRAIKKLTRKDFDFLYDQKKGGLYFNENGPAKGFGDGGIIAILKGAPDLSASNLDLI